MRSSGRNKSSVVAALVACGLTLVACVQALGLKQPTIRDGGAGPAAAACTTVTPDDNAVHACVMLYGCTSFVPNVNIGTCISFDYLTISGRVDCLRTAADCDDVLNCVGFKRADPTKECPKGSLAAKCTGNTGIECGDRNVVINCGPAGGTCTTYSSTDTGTQDRVGCELKLKTPCTGTASACTENKAHECRGGKAIGSDCTQTNGVCTAQDGIPGCSVIGPRCTTAGDAGGSVECEGDIAAFCAPSGRVTFPCKSGLTCATEVTDAGPQVACLAPGCGFAEDSACKDSCLNETTLLACVGGVKHPIDCTNPNFGGFTGCEEFEDKALGTYAKCR